MTKNGGLQYFTFCRIGPTLVQCRQQEEFQVQHYNVLQALTAVSWLACFLPIKHKITTKKNYKAFPTCAYNVH